jgi:hypothetical protein
LRCAWALCPYPALFRSAASPSPSGSAAIASASGDGDAGTSNHPASGHDVTGAPSRVAAAAIADATGVSPAIARSSHPAVSTPYDGRRSALSISAARA